MRVFIPENWSNLKNELSKFGRVVEIRKGDGSGECCAVIGKSLKMISGPKNLRDTLEILADLGFDFAALIGFDLEIEGLEKGIGFKIPRVNTVNDILRAPEIESLKSIVLKTKCVDGVEKCGAIGIFIGFVRKDAEGRTVKHLEYEAYEDVLKEKIEEIEKRVKKIPGVVNAKIYHKRGILMPGEDIVYITVMGEHRKDIWDPLMQAVEMMKEELPIWKKEVFEDGEVWVHDVRESRRES